MENYIVQLVTTRHPASYDEQLAQYLSCGVSPRASIAFDRCARAFAYLQGRDYVTPEDVQAIAPNILRHRLWLSFQAQANNVSSEDVIQQLLSLVPIT